MTINHSISIIIIHYGRVDFTVRLIAGIEQFAQDPNQYQIVVIDNGSPTEFPTDFQSKINLCIQRFEAGLGYGAAVNGAIQFCQHEKILILNNDLIFKTDVPRLLGQHWNERSRNSKLGLLGPAVFYPDGRFQLSWGYDLNLVTEFFERWTQKAMRTSHGFLYWLRRNLSRNPRTVDWISGVAMFTTQTVWKALRGFDPAFPFYYEDADLCRRSRGLGYQVIYESRVKIFHELGGAESKQSARIFNLKWQGHLAYYERYRGWLECVVLRVIFKVQVKRSKIEVDSRV